MVRLTAIALALATTLAATPPAQHLQRHARPISNTTRPVHDHAHQHQHGGGHQHGGHPHSRGAWLFVLATLLALPMCMGTGAAARAICGPLRGTAAPSAADSAEMENLRSDEDSSAQRALQSCFPYLPDLIKYAPAAGVVVAFLVINSSLSLLNRWALGLHGLRFPLLLTASHMIFGSALLSPLMLLHDGYYARHREEVCGRGKALAAIGLMNAAQISLNNWSLVYIELAINQVVRSMGPVLVAIIGIGVEGKVPTRRELGCLSVLTIGVALTLYQSRANEAPPAAAGEAAAGGAAAADCAARGLVCIAGWSSHAVGVGLAWLSTVIQCLQLSVSSRLMVSQEGGSGARLDPFQMTFYTGPVGFAGLLPFVLAFEMPAFVEALARAPAAALGFLLGSSLLAISYNVVLFQALRTLSAVGTAVLGNVKTVLLVLATAVLLGELLSWSGAQLVGAALALGASACYSWLRVTAPQKG